ncbi:hypothetical protein Tco_0327554 [Tanacetum coccineum]
MPNVRSMSNNDLFHLKPSLHLFALFSFLDSSDYGVGISNSLSDCPAGIVQTAKLRKIADTQEGGEESVIYIQECIRKVIEDVGEDDDFTRAPWLSVLDYVNVDGGIVADFLEMSRNFSRVGNLKKLLQLSSLVLRMRWAISQ